MLGLYVYYIYICMKLSLCEVLVLRCVVNGGYEERMEKKKVLIFN